MIGLCNGTGHQSKPTVWGGWGGDEMEEEMGEMWLDGLDMMRCVGVVM
jgi:hypothetical protein